jgi:hypothetical protein
MFTLKSVSSEHRLPDVAAVVDDGCLRAAVDLAGERIEGLHRGPRY